MLDKNKLFKNLPLIAVILIFVLPWLGKNGVFFIIAVFIIIYIIKLINPSSSRIAGLRMGKEKNMEFTDKTGAINMDKIKSFKSTKKTILMVIGAILLIWLFFASIAIVEAGEIGVYSLFGKVNEQELKSGFHLVIPLAKVTMMSIRTEEYTMSIISDEGQKKGADAITALTKEGLNVDLDMTVLYSLSEDSAADVYTTVGLDYVEKIIRPSIRSSIRAIIAQYEAKDIYSDKREEAAQNILENLRSSVEARGIIVEEVLLRNIVLPPNLATAIQEKLQAEQEAQKYEFILQREEKEKERKIIEAAGQRDAQSIINQSLTTNYLYYLYVNQLKDREGTIYVPTSPSTGMPLFRNIGN